MVSAKARMAPMTKTGPRRLQRSRASPSLMKAMARRARPDRPTPMASQRGSMAGPMALSVPWSRSRVSQSARAARAMRRMPPARLCGARTGPRCVRRLGAFVENRHGRPPGGRILRPRLLRPIWPEAAAWIKLPFPRREGFSTRPLRMNHPSQRRLLNYWTVSPGLMGGHLIPARSCLDGPCTARPGPSGRSCESGDVGLDENQGGLGSFKKTVLPAFRLHVRRISRPCRCQMRLFERFACAAPKPTYEAPHV